MANYSYFNSILESYAAISQGYMDEGKALNYVKIVGDMVYEMQNNRPTPEQIKKIDDFLDV
jgi:hypothetical protein